MKERESTGYLPTIAALRIWGIVYTRRNSYKSISSTSTDTGHMLVCKRRGHICMTEMRIDMLDADEPFLGFRTILCHEGRLPASSNWR
jgi:hypothetical protein